VEQALRRATRAANPELAAEFERTQSGQAARPAGRRRFPAFRRASRWPRATRASGDERDCRRVPELFGGRGGPDGFDQDDLQAGRELPRRSAGRNVFFGVREFGMCAAVNGMAAHGGLIPFGSTFFVFSDYCKPAHAAGGADEGALAVCVYARLDRAGRGRADAPADRAPDGAARGAATDGFSSGGRERDGGGWRLALERKGPSFFALSRQDLPVIDPAERTTCMPA
jgi:transketolase